MISVWLIEQNEVWNNTVLHTDRKHNYCFYKRRKVKITSQPNVGEASSGFTSEL